MDLSTLFQLFSSRLQEPLPGNEAHVKMSPSYRKTLAEMMELPGFSPKMGAVLLYLYAKNAEIHLVMIKRPEYLGVHSGQVAFPGGKMEETDADIIQTALREAFEEVGILPERVQVAGTLSPLYIPPSNFLVYPVIGFGTADQVFQPDSREVEYILEIPVSELFNPENQGSGRFRTTSSLTVTSPYYEIFREKIWGASAMILSEFLEVLKPLQ